MGQGGQGERIMVEVKGEHTPGSLRSSGSGGHVTGSPAWIRALTSIISALSSSS